MSATTHDEVNADVLEAVAARIEAAVGGWVPVAERLPEMREIYQGSPKQSARLLVTEGYHVYMAVQDYSLDAGRGGNQ
jgi:hypothetical protein